MWQLQLHAGRVLEVPQLQQPSPFHGLGSSPKRAPPCEKSNMKCIGLSAQAQPRYPLLYDEELFALLSCIIAFSRRQQLDLDKSLSNYSFYYFLQILTLTS